MAAAAAGEAAAAAAPAAAPAAPGTNTPGLAAAPPSSARREPSEPTDVRTSGEKPTSSSSSPNRPDARLSASGLLEGCSRPAKSTELALGRRSIDGSDIARELGDAGGELRGLLALLLSPEETAITLLLWAATTPSSGSRCGDNARPVADADGEAAALKVQDAADAANVGADAGAPPLSSARGGCSCQPAGSGAQTGAPSPPLRPAAATTSATAAAAAPSSGISSAGGSPSRNSLPPGAHEPGRRRAVLRSTPPESRSGCEPCIQASENAAPSTRDADVALVSRTRPALC